MVGLGKSGGILVVGCQREKWRLPMFLTPAPQSSKTFTPARFVPPVVYSRRSILVGKGNVRLGKLGRFHMNARIRDL